MKCLNQSTITVGSVVNAGMSFCIQLIQSS